LTIKIDKAVTAEDKSSGYDPAPDESG